MATISRSFRAQATPINAATLAATDETLSSDINLETDGYEGSHVQASVTFHASGTKDVVLSVYGSLDASTYDSIPLFSMAVPVTAGATKVLSLVVRDLLHFKVGAKHAASESNYAAVTVTEQSWRWASA